MPYVFHANLTQQNRTAALDAMAEIEAAAPVRFVPRTSELDFIGIISAATNSSYVGMVGGFQTVSIFDWASRYIICHELMHALGIVHEHQRPDRDAYVRINYPFIDPAALQNFSIASAATATTPYDFASIMHYSSTAFSNGFGPSIEALPAYASQQVLMGNRNHMTVLDVLGLQSAYGAPLPPVIESITPNPLPSSGPVTIDVIGRRFFRGSPSAAGVQGTRVIWNGSQFSSTYVSPTRIRFQVSSVAGQSCPTLAMENPAPCGGLSATMTIPNNAPVHSSTLHLHTYGPLQRDERLIDCLGDVTGDGVPEVIVGSYVQLRIISLPLLTHVHTFPALASSLGITWAAKGADFDRDGRRDYLLAVGVGWTVPPAAGRTIFDTAIYSGLTHQPILTIPGRHGGYVGTLESLTIGDADGDSVSDVAIHYQLPTYQGNPPGAHTIKLFSGANGAYLREFPSLTTVTYYEVVELGDLTMDGAPELALCEDGSPCPGVIRIVSSSSGQTIGTVANPGVCRSSVFSLGDVSSDGVPDFGLVGANHEVIVYSGSSLSVLYIRPRAGNNSSYYTNAIGDANGDGIQDYARNVSDGQLCSSGAASAPTGAVGVYSGRGGALLCMLPSVCVME